MIRLARVLVAVACVTVLPSEAAARWTRLNTAHFQFIGDAPAGQIRRVAEKLEQFREVMARALPGATTASPVRTIVVVFATDRSLAAVAPLFRGNATEVSGYLQPGEDLNYIALNGLYIDIALMTVFHEYSHLLVGNTVGNVPAWLNEGIAEFYAMTQGVDGGKSAVIGRAPSHHVDLLKSNTLIPIKELLSIDTRSQVYNEGNRRGVFYAQSWALAHYLILGSKERASQFRQYLSGLKNGVEREQAFSDAFGADTTALDRELFRYVRQFSFPGLELRFADKVVAEAERGTTMDDVEAEIYVADLQARIGREGEALARLRAIVARKPDAALAWSAIGLIDFRAQRLKEALPSLARGAEQAPRDAFVQTALGRALIAVLNEQTGDARSETARKARITLARAVELDASSSLAAALLGYVELFLGDDLPRAVAMLERASTLAPSREQYRLLLAQALLQQREFVRATDYLGPLLAGGSSTEVRNDARRLLGEVAARRSTGAAASVAAAQPGGDRLIALSSVTDVAVPSPPARMRLDLRVVQDGETRTLGLFRAIECQPNLVVLRVDADAGPLRLSARQLSDVDFVTYRSDAAGTVACGPLPTPMRVLATFRRRPAGVTSSPIDGDVVAIELLPDGFNADQLSR